MDLCYNSGIHEIQKKMVIKDRYKKHLLLTTVALLIFVFVSGILLGRTIGNIESGQVNEFVKENELNTESYLIEQELIENFDQNNCELAAVRIDDISNELANIGRRLTTEDAKETLGEENFNFLKRKFHLMQIKTYILFKRLTDSCNVSSDIILYYYKIDDQDSAEQGQILDQIVEDFDARVFAIEYDYSKELAFLESYYGIQETPSIVLNYNAVYRGLTDYDAIAKELII